MKLRAIRVFVEVNTESFRDYTGRLTKTMIMNFVPELQYMRGLKGIFSPLHISPLFTIKNGYNLDRAVYPRYTGEKQEKLEIIELSGEYVFQVGGVEELVNIVEKKLSQYMNKTIIQKFADSILEYKITCIADVTQHIMYKNLEGDSFTLYLKAPAWIYNVLSPSKIKKYTPNAFELLATPYFIYRGIPSIDTQAILELMGDLGRVVEKWYTLRTLKVEIIPFKQFKEPVLVGKASYIIIDERKKQLIENILKAAEITGIGASRLNGFGTTTWK